MTVIVTVLVLFMIAFPFFEYYGNRRYDDRWPSVTGELLETRIVVVGTEPHKYRPSEIDYRVEARVAYELDGIHHDAWLPASNVVSDKALLASWLSLKKSKVTTVYWNPRNPSDVQVVLN